MHNFALILTLTAGLVAALIGGYVTQRLRLSPIVGYLIAGILVGPFTPGFAADLTLAEQLAEIKHLGATAEQIDRERTRVRAELAE
jgi:monovalent cation:H+ antiporter-2, CPA2 family